MEPREPSAPAMPAPARTSICLHCRTALFDEEACDLDPTHATASIAEIYGRECLIATVWGPPRARFEQIQAEARTSSALTGLAAFGTAAGMLASTMFFPVATAATAVLSGAVSGSAFWIFGKRAVGQVEHTYPVGAEPVPEVEPGAGQRAVVRGEPSLLSPATGSECVAYALELHYEGSFGTRVMYRDAVCTDFDLELGDRQCARVAAGRIRLSGHKLQAIDFDNLRVERHVAEFDQKHSVESGFDPLRYNVVYEQVLMAGDPVRLVNPLEPIVDATALPCHYRESMASYLSPIGIPRLRLDRSRS